jgi:hypothetical protein
MNLNYAYDKQALEALIAKADKSLDEHNLAIDFDGEVLIDPEKDFPNVPLQAYQFASRIRNASMREPIMVTALYDSLEMIYQTLINTSYQIGREGNSISMAA